MSRAQDNDDAAGELRELVAYPTTPRQSIDIVPAPRWRDWINSMDERWANRCLPLLVANEAGWALLNPAPFRATWGGSPDAASITIEFGEEIPQPHPVATHFGYGILTWSVPYLFRTPPGWNLLARGPANWPKDGATALEGLVETDWSVATFTMNWQLTRPGLTVSFDRDEPFCMIVPQRRGDLASFRPMIADLTADPATHAQAEEFARARDQLQIRKFLSNFSGEFEPYRDAWEQNYFRGIRPDGSQAPEHQTSLGLKKFERD